MFTTSVNVLNICASLFLHVCVHDVVSVQWQYVRIKMIKKKTQIILLIRVCQSMNNYGT